MRSNAIFRIILYSLAIFILLSILLTALLFGIYMNKTGSGFEVSNTAQKLPVASDGVTAQGAVSAEEIRNIEIEWVAGSITIHPVENTELITISESGNDNEKYIMEYRQKGSTLKIQYCDDDITFPSFGISISDIVSKDLVVTVPMGWICDTLEIDTASACVDVNDLTIHEFNFDGASGVCSIMNCNVDEIDLDTASGNITFEGTLDMLDCDAASANCRVTVTNVPSSIEIDTASGDLDLTFPDNCGFTCNLTTMSGEFTSDFPTTSHNGNHVHGDGSCRINVSAMSGDVTIRRSSESAPMITEPAPDCTDPSCTDKSHGHSNHH